MMRLAIEVTHTLSPTKPCLKPISQRQHISWLRASESIIAYLINAPVPGPRICLHAHSSARQRAIDHPSHRRFLPAAPNSFSCASRSKTHSLSCAPSAARRATCTSPPSPAACLSQVSSSRAGPRSTILIGSIGRCRCSWSCGRMDGVRGGISSLVW